MLETSTYTIFDAYQVSNRRRVARGPFQTETPSLGTYPTVWLIDDDGFANFIAERTIRQTRFAEEVVTFTTVEDALRLLDKAVAQQPALLPSVIFLDLNMPHLNGWDFLQAFEQLPEFVRNSCTLYILSATENASDLVRSKGTQYVRACISKPLSNEDLEVIKLRQEGTWE